MTDEEYLNGPLIEGVTYSITEDAIKITSDSTVYIDIKRLVPLDIQPSYPFSFGQCPFIL